VIGTILLVGITVVLAATLYLMAFGFGGNSTNLPPTANFTRSSVADGFKWTFTPFSKDTTWSDIYIILDSGPSAIAFDNMTGPSMTGSPNMVVSFGSRDLGNLTVFMNATDLAGNGYVNQGDSLTLTTSGGAFQTTVNYEIHLMHRGSGAQIVSMIFQGA
jgi:hypothetical protein